MSLTAAERAALARARDLAEGGRGRVSPNPLVGAVVLQGERTVRWGGTRARACRTPRPWPWRGGGRGPRRHRRVHAGALLPPGPHPALHRRPGGGRVARVVIGCADPLERGRDQGREVLRAAGIEVVVANGADGRACAEQNAAFLTWAITGLPHVTLKLATSLDGKIATATGESRWISGPASRALVHRWRADHDAVAVGLGTALADDPRLTARDVEGPCASRRGSSSTRRPACRSARPWSWAPGSSP